MDAKTVKSYLEEAVKYFENGERDQAKEVLETLDISLVVESLDFYPFKGNINGLDIREETVYFMLKTILESMEKALRCMASYKAVMDRRIYEDK